MRMGIRASLVLSMWNAMLSASERAWEWCPLQWNVSFSAIRYLTYPILDKLTPLVGRKNLMSGIPAIWGYQRSNFGAKRAAIGYHQPNWILFANPLLSEAMDRLPFGTRYLNQLFRTQTSSAYDYQVKYDGGRNNGYCNIQRRLQGLRDVV